MLSTTTEQFILSTYKTNSIEMAAAMVSRSIKKIENPRPSPRWGGHVRVIEPPYKLFDPFIFLVHHVHSFAPGERTGFPAHPHR